MEKYDIIGPLGEGSFGRVYKAKQLATEEFVALKVISKRGRTPKEIKNLRKECEIQRTLNHPNIIQMLDSFETNDEIVVITEFAHKALHVILGNKGFLPENRVQTIVWDLVSALYYLHSHRVLHRDLKPQNILLDARDRAKLCDFGFARNMSTGTHVLTSIKGTPLYMAPELIDELPYDHNADLWSLGCIIYELLVGAPPFCTVSILHLIRLIRYKPVEWPTSLSQNCISFLKGLLQKDPKQRFTWATILDHPFVKGHILIQENDLDMPLTRPMSSNTLQRKEEQHNGHVNNKIGGQSTKALLKAFEVEDKKSGHSKTSKNSENGHSSNQNPHCFELDLKNNNSQPNLSEKFNNLSLESDLQKNNSVDFKSSKEFTSTFKLTEECHPIETEEWIAFLQKSIEEIINGEIISISQPNLANILVSPLRNSNTCPKVVTYVAKLFSIPFVVKEISKKSLEQIKKVYLEVKLVPNLVYSSKLLLRQKSLNTDSGPSSENSPLFNNPEKQKTLDEITENDLDGLENIFLLISHLVFLEEDFLLQFCDAIAVLNIYPLLQILIKLSRRKLRIVLDLIAILTHILRKFPEHIELVEKILINDLTNENDYIDFNILLRHEDMILRERICFCLMFLSKCNSKILETMWNENMKETLEALMFDSIEIVRNAAEKCVEEIKRHPYYYRIEITT